LLALGILQKHWTALKCGTQADRLHLQIEALRLAFADALKYVADPEHAIVPVEQLLSEV
jgi:gamma-glutamyltranspeptidase/glutathione hydrolase